MATFPSTLKPSITNGYGFGAPDNVITQQVQGGDPLNMLDYRTGPVSFNVAMALDPLRLQVFQDFYFGKINSGADKFTMVLDSGNGLEDHTVKIDTTSLRFNGDRAPIWSVSFTIIAETTPFQENPFGGDLSDLYDEYGNDLPALLEQLEILALIDLP